MLKQISAFKIKVNGKRLDYRLGDKLNLESVRAFFEKKYKVKKIWTGGRHVLAILEKSGRELFLKLATTEGISAVTKIEFEWNNQFNKQIPRSSNFWVPKNYDSGICDNRLFYLITDKLEGKPLSKWLAERQISDTLSKSIPRIIEFSELIQNLQVENLIDNYYPADYRLRFITKTKSWLENIPQNIKKKYNLQELLEIVEGGTTNLAAKPRHGDFAPWHLIGLTSGQLGLIDAEHAMANGVEGYDISYFIQRVFSVLQNPDLSQKILAELTKRNYQTRKLKVVLAARAIGGFLDESLTPSPNYFYSNKFKDWVISLSVLMKF